jgi:hypothetical protein
MNLPAMKSLGKLSLLAVLASGCANIPKTSVNSLQTDKPLELVTEQQGRKVARYVDGQMLSGITGFALPKAQLLLPGPSEYITQDQLDIISNALNRSMCNRLGQYLTARTEPKPEDLQIEFALTGITPTSRVASGVSAAAGFFVPGPFRLPIGMGAIALDAKATTNEQTAAFMRWAKGANPVFNSGKVSTIADAYELVETFSREFAELLLEGADSVKTRTKLPEQEIDGNEAICLANFGAVNLASKGASFFLPLAPELIDSGKPKEVEDSGKSN